MKKLITKNSTDMPSSVNRKVDIASDEQEV